MGIVSTCASIAEQFLVIDSCTRFVAKRNERKPRTAATLCVNERSVLNVIPEHSMVFSMPRRYALFPLFPRQIVLVHDSIEKNKKHENFFFFLPSFPFFLFHVPSKIPVKNKHTAEAKVGRWPNSLWRGDLCHNRHTWLEQHMKPAELTFRVDNRCRLSK